MNEGLKIICRATAINHQSAASSAEILIESGSERKSVSINDSQDFPISAGDKIFCLVGKVAISVPKKPGIRLFTLSSQKIERASAMSNSPKSNDKMVIEERIFNVMRILSNE